MGDQTIRRQLRPGGAGRQAKKRNGTFHFFTGSNDAANHLTYQDTVYHDGSAVETGYNVTGAGGWTHYTAQYDAAGNETHETDFYTDGTRAEVSFDLAQWRNDNDVVEAMILNGTDRYSNAAVDCIHAIFKTNLSSAIGRHGGTPCT